MRTGKHLKDEKLRRRLDELGEEANKHHLEAIAVQGVWLEHARQAGKALEEAHWRTGGRSKWRKWRERHFRGKKRTVNIYRQIYNRWDELEAAQREGNVIPSIRAALRVLQKESKQANENEAAQDDHNKRSVWDQLDELHPERLAQIREELDTKRREKLREAFLSKLDGLKWHEVRVLAKEFDRHWERLYERLQRRVCAAFDTDFYGDDEPKKPEVADTEDW